MSTQIPAAPAFLDLDDLLAESVQQVAEQKAAKALLGKIRYGSASQAERAQAATVELKAEWQATGGCEVWDQTVCECGHSHAVFSHHMIEYQPLRRGQYSAKRYIKADPEAVPSGLPPKVIMNIREVFHCIECSHPPEDAELIVWDGTVTPPESFEV